MADNARLSNVKAALGVTGEYQDDTIKAYIAEVVAYIKDAGVADDKITDGLIARGVSDLWNYNTGKLSDYFIQRVIQLKYK